MRTNMCVFLIGQSRIWIFPPPFDTALRRAEHLLSCLGILNNMNAAVSADISLPGIHTDSTAVGFDHFSVERQHLCDHCVAHIIQSQFPDPRFLFGCHLNSSADTMYEDHSYERPPSRQYYLFIPRIATVFRIIKLTKTGGTFRAGLYQLLRVHFA